MQPQWGYRGSATVVREVTASRQKIKQQIESLNGAGQVEIIGGVNASLGLGRTDNCVLTSDSCESNGAARYGSAGGRVDEGTRELTVRTMGRIVNTAEFNDLAVANRGTYSVKLSDIGYAEDGAEEARTEARLNGQPAVTLVVSKQSGQNTVSVADAVKERLREIAPTLLQVLNSGRRRPVHLH